MLLQKLISPGSKLEVLLSVDHNTQYLMLSGYYSFLQMQLTPDVQPQRLHSESRPTVCAHFYVMVRL
jgi:hypothetical protein